MWIKKADRKGLIDVLGGDVEAGLEGRYSEVFPTESIYGDDLYLVWESSPKGRGHLPALVVVAEGHERDFVAWASTYLPNYRPFTAYFRVVDTNTIRTLKSLTEIPSLRGIEASCVGLVIGEALTLAPDPKRPASLSPVACSSTYSYCMVRALAVGIPLEELDHLGHKWALARNLTGQPLRKVEVEVIKHIVCILSLLRNNSDSYLPPERPHGVPKTIMEACRQLHQEGMISGPTWAEVTHDVEGLNTVKERMEAPREERVKYFQSVVPRIVASSHCDSLSRAFISGYLATLIAPGSMSHVDLVAEHISQIPMVLVWYGLCSGFYRKNEVLSSFNVLGRRLLRELLKTENMLASPSADISVSELQALLEGNGQPIEFRTFSSNHMVVELLPLVSTYLSMTRQVDSRQLQLFAPTEKPQVSKKLLTKLGSLLKQAVKVHEQLAEPSGPSRLKGSRSGRKTKKSKPN